MRFNTYPSHIYYRGSLHIFMRYGEVLILWFYYMHWENWNTVTAYNPNENGSTSLVRNYLS